MDDDITSTPSDDDDDPSALPIPCHRDGRTDFAHRLFLKVLAETGWVGRACAHAALTPQSAYALATATLRLLPIRMRPALARATLLPMCCGSRRSIASPKPSGAMATR